MSEPEYLTERIQKRYGRHIINTIDTEKLPGYKTTLTEEYWKNI